MAIKRGGGNFGNRWFSGKWNGRYGSQHPNWSAHKLNWRKSYSSLAELKLDFDRLLEAGLESVREDIYFVMQEAFDDRVYSYVPQEGERAISMRRYDAGGLRARENIKIDISPKRVSVQAVASGQEAPSGRPPVPPKTFDAMIEEGTTKMVARPFYEYAEEMIVKILEDLVRS